ncbi:hypothetical protein [Kineosporia babensis]|uniref:Uncharacterized protein n=1 Tax=Kineosporia babensis TaxID=499548 RepID=A0A9X1NKH7_9ACTN|nr:hypothetical protein [Kineosporia babensis]MCD5314841.1 hypothetical protein [Kineosporia babensis]
MCRLARGEDGRWLWTSWSEGETDLNSLAHPFDPDCVKDEFARYDSEEPPREDVVAWDAWDNRWDELMAQQTRGAVLLAHQGCGYWDWLVVSGPRRGSVWDDARGVDVPLRQ